MDLERVGQLVLQIDGLLLGEVEVLLIQALLSDLAPQQLVIRVVLLVLNRLLSAGVDHDHVFAAEFAVPVVGRLLVDLHYLLSCPVGFGEFLVLAGVGTLRVLVGGAKETVERAVVVAVVTLEGSGALHWRNATLLLDLLEVEDRLLLLLLVGHSSEDGERFFEVLLLGYLPEDVEGSLEVRLLGDLVEDAHRSL